MLPKSEITQRLNSETGRIIDNYAGNVYGTSYGAQHLVGLIDPGIVKLDDIGDLRALVDPAHDGLRITLGNRGLLGLNYDDRQVVLTLLRHRLAGSTSLARIIYERSGRQIYPRQFHTVDGNTAREDDLTASWNRVTADYGLNPVDLDRAYPTGRHVYRGERITGTDLSIITAFLAASRDLPQARVLELPDRSQRIGRVIVPADLDIARPDLITVNDALARSPGRLNSYLVIKGAGAQFENEEPLVVRARVNTALHL